MFDYSSIPTGYYDKILTGKKGMRRFWHWHKFESVKRVLAPESELNIIDVGCFAGSFLGRFFPKSTNYMLGVDILNSQIEYANDNFKTLNLKFKVIEEFNDLIKLDPKFHICTFIEVIEHLDDKEIVSFFDCIYQSLKDKGILVLTTPNYSSLWPILEVLINRFSKVTYEEQHINKFTYKNIESRLSEIYPLFSKKFQIELKTTSHFLSPFFAICSYTLAIKLSRIVLPKKWKNPFGSMIILKIRKI